jgi:hypothetical protein
MYVYVCVCVCVCHLDVEARGFQDDVLQRLAGLGHLARLDQIKHRLVVWDLGDAHDRALHRVRPLVRLGWCQMPASVRV